MRIGIDLGGTKIEICVLDSEGKSVLRERIATPQGDYEGTINAIVCLVQQAEQRVGQRATIGIGTPGAISTRTGLMKNSNSVCLNGRPLQRDIESSLQREIRISNDANCFALSEAVDGAAQGADVVFGVIIGTGTGAGVVVHQRVLEGPNRIAGEWGHNPLPWPREDEFVGPECYCGKRGCIETYLSGPGLQRDHQRITGQSLTTHQIVENSRRGDVDAQASLQRYYDRMARSLAHVINILDPDVIVLGGGMSNISELYLEIPTRLSSYVFSDTVSTRIVSAKQGDSSGVLGAAWLW